MHGSCVLNDIWVETATLAGYTWAVLGFGRFGFLWGPVGRKLLLDNEMPCQFSESVLLEKKSFRGLYIPDNWAKSTTISDILSINGLPSSPKFICIQCAKWVTFFIPCRGSQKRNRGPLSVYQLIWSIYSVVSRSDEWPQTTPSGWAGAPTGGKGQFIATKPPFGHPKLVLQ